MISLCLLGLDDRPARTSSGGQPLVSQNSVMSIKFEFCPRGVTKIRTRFINDEQTFRLSFLAKGLVVRIETGRQEHERQHTAAEKEKQTRDGKGNMTVLAKTSDVLKPDV